MGSRKSKKKKRQPKRNPFYVTDIQLFDDTEGTFIDNVSKRRVYVHQIPAPWSRVILLSLIYAFAINFAKIGWYQIFGRPEWFAVPKKPAVEGTALPKATNSAPSSNIPN